MFANGLLIGGVIDAIDRIARNVTVDPLDLRTHAAQHAARLLGEGPQLFGFQVAGTGNLSFNDVFRHGADSTTYCKSTNQQVPVGAQMKHGAAWKAILAPRCSLRLSGA